MAAHTVRDQNQRPTSGLNGGVLMHGLAQKHGTVLQNLGGAKAAARGWVPQASDQGHARGS
ncbi:hypothetical protein NBRC116584_22760 [Hydrogenophaga sp. 5NK40-0174]